MVKFYFLLLFVSSFSLNSQILTISTTSKSSEWSPQKVVKMGGSLTWIASSTGMTDQVQITNGNQVPVFDFSVSRTSSDVRIEVTSIDGVSGFTELSINSLNINAINLSKAIAISALSCTDNQLTELDVKNNTSLINLFCHSNQLKNLDISQNLLLSILACFSNQISILNILQNNKLTSLSCSNNLLESLDLSNNNLLESLECDFNNLNSLNVKNGNNTIIQIFRTSNNSSLFCIQVDDVNYSTANWLDVDSWSIFNEDCTFSPKAIDDFYSTKENVVLTVGESNGILSNDSDPKGKPLTAILVSDVSNGLLTLNLDGSFNYIPDQNISGKDLFTYKTNNGENDSNIATVTIEIDYVNKPPVANDNSYSTSENLVLNINKNDGVLANDTDPEGDVLMAVLENNVSNGILELNSDGSFKYAPSDSYFGIDSFTYRANDGEFNSNIATVYIEMIPVNEPPVANDNFYTTSENIELDIDEPEGVLSNDTDSDGDLLTVVLVSSVNNGNLVLKPNGSFIYTPDPNFNGLEIFTYMAFDGISNSNEAQVEITVQEGYDLVMPNAFTPNNDNINDWFKPEFKGMKWVKITIYDTWGNLIYFEEGTSIIGWDGIIKGDKAENGNYLYNIMAQTNQDENISREGLFTLIK